MDGVVRAMYNLDWRVLLAALGYSFKHLGYRVEAAENGPPGWTPNGMVMDDYILPDGFASQDRKCCIHFWAGSTPMRVSIFCNNSGHSLVQISSRELARYVWQSYFAYPRHETIGRKVISEIDGFLKNISARHEPLEEPAAIPTPSQRSIDYHQRTSNNLAIIMALIIFGLLVVIFLLAASH